MNVVQFIQSGGFMMYPLIICSFVLLSLIVERLVVLRKAAVDGDELLEEVKKVYRPGSDSKAAVELAQQYRGPIGKIYVRGLRNANRPADSIEMAMEQEAANEMPTLEANLPIIKTIVNISPLLGLLGTIAGMITAFRAAAAQGLSNPTQILGGISEALISTATGISLAVIGFIFYNYFANVVKKQIEDMEYYGAELVNYLTGRLD